MTRIIRTPAGTQPEHDNFPSRPKSHSQAQRPQDVEAEIDFHPPPTHQSESTTQTLPYPPSVLQSLTLLSSTTTSPKTHTTHIIPSAHGHAFYLGPNKSFRIVDLHGQQVVDLMAWTSPGDPRYVCDIFDSPFLSLSVCVSVCGFPYLSKDMS